MRLRDVIRHNEPSNVSVNMSMSAQTAHSIAGSKHATPPAGAAQSTLTCHQHSDIAIVNRHHIHDCTIYNKYGRSHLRGH